MTREELASMPDEELLTYMREKCGNPYMPLSIAKEMRHLDLKWWHQTAAWEKSNDRRRTIDFE